MKLTQKQAREMFEYLPDGRLKRISTKTGEKIYPGARGSHGYLQFCIGRHYFLNHRVIWLWHHGTLPKYLDHIDCDKQNNRIENLRECTNSQNHLNTVRHLDNKTGIKGVSYEPRCTKRPWAAQLVVRGIRIINSHHATKEEAAEAYATGAAKYAEEFATRG
jgi:hypothetical protein